MWVRWPDEAQGQGKFHGLAGKAHHSPSHRKSTLAQPPQEAVSNAITVAIALRAALRATNIP